MRRALALGLAVLSLAALGGCGGEPAPPKGLLSEPFSADFVLCGAYARHGSLDYSPQAGLVLTLNAQNLSAPLTLTEREGELCLTLGEESLRVPRADAPTQSLFLLFSDALDALRRDGLHARYEGDLCTVTATYAARSVQAVFSADGKTLHSLVLPEAALRIELTPGTNRAPRDGQT